MHPRIRASSAARRRHRLSRLLRLDSRERDMAPRPVELSLRPWARRATGVCPDRDVSRANASRTPTSRDVMSRICHRSHHNSAPRMPRHARAGNGDTRRLDWPGPARPKPTNDIPLSGLAVRLRTSLHGRLEAAQRPGLTEATARLFSTQSRVGERHARRAAACHTRHVREGLVSRAAVRTLVRALTR